MKLKFLGAAETVTGSRTLITHRGQHYLVDCGLFQGSDKKRDLNWDSNFDVKRLDGIFLTHAHIDHSGMLPRVVKLGYKGPIYCSQATFDLCQIMLLDAAHIQEEDARYANETKHSSHNPALPLYTKEDALASLQLFKPIKMDEWHEITPDISIRLTRAGHILGSSFVEINYSVEGNGGFKKITFTGDIGNNRQQTIKGPAYLKESDFLVLESTYGDRLQPKNDPCELLGLFINNIIAKQGVVVIPTFTVGRAQEVLYYIKKLQEDKIIPITPVYVDSPMANSANRVFYDHQEEHKLSIGEDELKGPLCPTKYHEINSTQASKELIQRDGPFIVLSAAGMLTGGRVLHHLKKRLPGKENGVIFVGYMVENTKGRRLQDGAKTIRIHHEEIEVHASIFTIEGLSAHGDYMDMINWLEHFQVLPKCIFLNHGELHASTHFKNILEGKFGVKVHIVKHGEEIDTVKWDWDV
ncbi:MAG: MBL fold metallo-hydrolase [Bacteriovoracaceae bacterium]|nr:MBL fold metallo-hydrolase [Bacteriovoracaceae bacterium]